MLNVGLTGGIATGKSTVVRMLVRKGARVIDHDRIVHDLQEPGKPVWRKIVEVFGRGVLDDDDQIDRKQLGAIVFDDEQKRKTLEGIVHPAVIEEWQGELGVIADAEIGAIVLSDIPLLIEADLQDRVDLVLLVYAPQDVQIRRVMNRNSLSCEEAQARINAQMPIDEKLRYAQVVIRNDGTMMDLEKRVDEVWQELQELEQKKK
jgi:dephospho-CoA kinase